MTEPTEAEKIEIVERKFGGMSADAMRNLEAGNARCFFVTVDEELERVLRKIGLAKFRGLTIYRRDTGEPLRESHTHPATKQLQAKLRSAARRDEKYPQIGVDANV